jgi:hypothetical protein
MNVTVKMDVGGLQFVLGERDGAWAIQRRELEASDNWLANNVSQFD